MMDQRLASGKIHNFYIVIRRRVAAKAGAIACIAKDFDHEYCLCINQEELEGMVTTALQWHCITI